MRLLAIGFFAAATAVATFVAMNYPQSSDAQEASKVTVPGQEARMAARREGLALLKRADEARQRGDLETAEKLIRQCISGGRAFFEAHLSLARLLQGYGRSTEAIEEYELFLKPDPHRGSSYQHDPCIKVEYARLLETVGQSARADRVYDAVYTDAYPSDLRGGGHLQIVQGGTTPAERKAIANVIAGITQMLPDPTEAGAYLREAIRANPRCPEAWYFLGQELVDLPGSHAEARQALLRAKTLGGHRADIAKAVETVRDLNYHLPGWSREQFYR